MERRIELIKHIISLTEENHIRIVLMLTDEELHAIATEHIVRGGTLMCGVDSPPVDKLDIATRIAIKQHSSYFQIHNKEFVNHQLAKNEVKGLYIKTIGAFGTHINCATSSNILNDELCEIQIECETYITFLNNIVIL